MSAVRTRESRVLGAVERRSQMRRTLIRRQIDEQDDQLGEQVAVGSKKVCGPVADEVSLSGSVRQRPAGELPPQRLGECVEHGAGQLRPHEPAGEILPEGPYFDRQQLRPALAHFSLISVFEMIELEIGDRVKV